MTEHPSRRRSALWVAIGVVAIVGILGNIAIAFWLLSRNV